MTYNQEEMTVNQVENTLVNGVVSVVSRRTTPWVGTITELNNVLVKKFGTVENWPRSASALRVSLNKVVNRIRNKGVSIRFMRSTDHNRTRLVVIQ
jgi:hypothetical protein